MMSSAFSSGPLLPNKATGSATGNLVENSSDTNAQPVQPAPARPPVEDTFEYSGKVSLSEDSSGTDLYAKWTSQSGEPSDGDSLAVEGGNSKPYDAVTDSYVAEETLQYIEEKNAQDPLEAILMPGAGLDRRYLANAEFPEVPLSPAQTRDLAELGGDFHSTKLDFDTSLTSKTGNAVVPAEKLFAHPPAEVVPTPTPQEPKEEENLLTPVTFKMVVMFCLPALGAVLTDPLMSLVDTACVGQISSIGLASLGPNTTIFGFVSMVFQFLTTATTAMVARSFDRGEKKEAGRAVSDGLLLAVMCGVIASAGVISFSPQMFAMLNTSSELLAPATSYLVWRAIALPCTLISLVGAAACLGQRDPGTPLRVAALSGLVNLVVDLYLVLGPPQMGVTGAAIATAGSQLMASILYIRTLSQRLPLAFRFPYWSRVKPFITAGSVLTLRSICLMSALSLMTVKAASMGTIAIASHQVVVGMLTLMQFVPEPISQAAQTYLASTAAPLKKGTCTVEEKKFAQNTGRLLMKVAAGLGLSLATFSALVVKFAPFLFTSDAVVMSAVSALAPQLWLTVAVYAVVNSMDGLVFAGADMKYAAGVQVVNLPVMVLLLSVAESLGMALGGVWYAMVAFTSVRFLENATRLFNQYMTA